VKRKANDKDHGRWYRHRYYSWSVHAYV
jgi:hypothetical protein